MNSDFDGHYVWGRRAPVPNDIEEENRIVTEMGAELDWSEANHEDLLAEKGRYCASMFLQMRYEDYCVGESSRSFLNSKVVDDDYQKAKDKFEGLREDLLPSMVQMFKQTRDIRYSGQEEVKLLDLLAYIWGFDESELLEPYVGTTIRTLLQTASYGKGFRKIGKMFQQDLITTLGERLDMQITSLVKKTMDIDNHKGDLSNLTEKQKEVGGILNSLNKEQRKDLNKIRENGFHGLKPKRQEKPFEKIAYNICLLLMEKGWISLRNGERNDFTDILGISQDEIENTGKQKPHCFVLGDNLYKKIHGEQKFQVLRENFETDQGGVNNHAIFRHFSTDRDRWMYVQPIKHAWDDFFEVWNLDSPTYSEDDRLFVKDRGSFDEGRIVGTASPGGFLTAINTNNSRNDGYKTLHHIVSNQKVHSQLGANAEFSEGEGRKWYQGNIKVGRETGVANKETVDALNNLQQTQWEINLHFLSKIANFYGRNKQLFSEEFLLSKIEVDGVCPLQEISMIKFKDDIRMPENEDVREEWVHLLIGDEKPGGSWVKKILANNGNTFWHAWHCDWRGRLYPRCTILGPQGGDLSRALLRFKEWRPLGERGWFWLRVHLFNLMNWPGMPSSKSPFSVRAAWIEKHIEAFEKIIDGEEGAREWQDLPLAKDQSMQRFAAMIEVVRVYREHKKWVSEGKEDCEAWGLVKSGLPIQLDASSNGFQHLAALLRNRNLAEAVNVITNPKCSECDGEMGHLKNCQYVGHSNPEQDLYQRVAEYVRKMNEEDIRYCNECGDETKNAQCCGFSTQPPRCKYIFTELDGDVSKLADMLYHRDLAKTITMTMPYGAGDFVGLFMGNKKKKPGWKKRHYAYQGKCENTFICHELGCKEKEFQNFEKYEKHILDKHLDKESEGFYEIIPLTLEDVQKSIPETEEGEHLIPHTIETVGREIIHVLNLNKGKSKKKGAKGGLGNPYENREKALSGQWNSILSKTGSRSVYYLGEGIECTSNVIGDQVPGEGNEKIPGKVIYKFTWSGETAPRKNEEGLPLRREFVDRSTPDSFHSEGVWVPVWHKNSILERKMGRDSGFEIDYHRHPLIAKAIAQDFERAVRHITGNAFEVVEKQMKKLVRPVDDGRPRHRSVFWTTSSGFRVRQYHVLKHYDDRWGRGNSGLWTGYWGSNEAPNSKMAETLPMMMKLFGGDEDKMDQLIRNSFKKKRRILQQLFLTLGIPYNELESLTEEFGNMPYQIILNNSVFDFEEFQNFLDGEGKKIFSKPLAHGIQRELGKLKLSDGWKELTKEEFQKFADLQKLLITSHTFSRRNYRNDIWKAGVVESDPKKYEKYGKEEDICIREMRKGITPNFIHSLDAAHMTKVVNRMCSDGVTSDFWAVHDCFGVHPSFTDRLIDCVRDCFAEIHQESFSDWMDKLSPEHDYTQDDEFEIGDSCNDESVMKSEYLIS